MSSAVRVCRTEAGRYAAATSSGAPLHARHAEIAALLRVALPETTAHLFAQPMPSSDGGFVDWVTPLPGQPVPLSALPPDQRVRVAALLTERLAAIRALARRLPDKTAAAVLMQAAVDPGADQVYAMNGQPVVIGWGQAGQFAPPPVVPPVAVAAAPRRSWWRWLLAALLALALLATALLLLCRCDEIPPPAVEPPAAATDDLDDLRARIRAAEDEIRRRLELCVTPKAEEPPKIESPAVEPPKVEEPKVSPKPPVEKPKVEKPTAPPPRTTACPPKRQSWEQPEVMLMLDASGSMRLPKEMADSAVESLMRRAMRGDRAAMATLQGYRGGAGSRLAAAKEATKGVIAQMPKDVDVGLLVFGKCEGADNYNFFKAAQRPALLSLVDRIQPEQGTPLARGLERAGNMLDGVNVPGVIVVVTDGEDSCGGDPCAVARALKQKKPNLKINVIDVGGSGKGRCMAEASGGRMVTPRPGQSWKDIFMQATEQKVVPPGCE